ncbi:hypothetical protein AcW1_005930 [Taiwanofungus camphoratus]|nr:hypothetical protein AcV5_006246 [Antrodia cinnamomea]KAI0950321.1 hypothetical protein AcV7_008827 [Antrodia cinnamomea]KAI0957584.1 hypothetical protein AcW1_005930 [Antrodia cinnamomea]
MAFRPTHTVSGIKDIYTDELSVNNLRVKLSSSTPFTPTYVKSHVLTSADPDQIYKSRVQGRQVPLENPPRESKRKKSREEKRAKRLADKATKDAGVISLRGARRNGIWRLHESETKFDLFLPLHSLWMGYMSELLALSTPSGFSNSPISEAAPSAAAMHTKLVKADFHGALLTVRQSKNPCLIGLSGIVVHETENAFKVVTRKDQLKLIPKQNSIFTFAVPLYSTLSSGSSSSAAPLGSPTPPDVTEGASSPSSEVMQTVLDLPHIDFELYGNQFCYRAAERAGRKFKHKETIEL